MKIQTWISKLRCALCYFHGDTDLDVVTCLLLQTQRYGPGCYNTCLKTELPSLEIFTACWLVTMLGLCPKCWQNACSCTCIQHDFGAKVQKWSLYSLSMLYLETKGKKKVETPCTMTKTELQIKCFCCLFLLLFCFVFVLTQISTGATFWYMLLAWWL